ncbi:MAG: TlpA disulfide reductase family protein [Bacteroidota bacterium]|nr:TlpA disulfide reductase family protein [Bacteroidota bacterium]MDP4232249.1 TlpA disulfide reductase family protein [Bacteroidota bacterium]MDP4242651.1 TlpA disulfide reductase family protein [Bacteroidota bacterium]MDP4286787.1 TlpA disulfide reductase family protein [Bacteroidota bacterium]
MASRRSALFVPIVVGLALAASFAVYKLSSSQDLLPDSARAATRDAATRDAAETMDTAAQAPRPAPDFELKDLDGNVHHLSDYRGKVVVLNFWATWCPPCRKEIPDFIELQKQLAPQGVQFLGIALDDEGLPKVKPWVASHGFSYPILLPDAAGKVVASYGEMSSIPVTYFIDRKGVIRSTFIGMRQRPVIEKELAPLVAEK